MFEHKTLKHRAGVTVIEVLFSTGIAVFGLIGIASLIGVAGRQASQANEVAEAQALANSWYADFVTRGFNNSNQWRAFNDQSTSTVYSSKFPTFASIAGTSFTSSTTVNSSRTGFRHAVCIDPAFFADASNISAMTPTSTGNIFPNSQAYRPGLFPYYQDNFDPLTDPFSFSPPTGTLGSDMPRLLRLSLANSAGAGIMVETLVDQIFRSHDDLGPVQDEEDKTLAATRFVGTGGSKLLSKGEYSWFATLSPREFGSSLEFSGPAQEKLYTLDIVVMHRRDKQFFVPNAGGVENIPQGERLLGVDPPFVTGSTTNYLPFTGGSGGRVILSASVEVSDKIRVGDWVMLARHQDFSAATSFNRSVVVRWFRVIGVDGDATLVPPVAPATVPTRWSRNVILDGPDWVFDSANPTQATLVTNVVTVLERVIPVQ